MAQFRFWSPYIFTCLVALSMLTGSPTGVAWAACFLLISLFDKYLPPRDERQEGE